MITHATADDVLAAEARVARLGRELEDLHRRALAKLTERREAEAERDRLREYLTKSPGN